ncbi:aminoglycoside phosphotransferase family protein [Streptomyces sp. NBC_00859]|uniref:aminoglycoside phosphotransferase family protein n=1 Tax=Streptomyces sp. NBC_00859 TaxID=2903682 RepID=UPI0038646ABD|nr:aminoglycoside phosphotransferase family protein [Streptomyces sp. NBC_00859]
MKERGGDGVGERGSDVSEPVGDGAGAVGRAGEFLERWGLGQEGPPMRGHVAVVLPVVRKADGVRAALKLQDVDAETVGEPFALRAWGGRGAVRLLDHDPVSGTMLLERLDEARPLSSVPDVLAATEVIAGLLARLTSVPAPEGTRQLGDIAARMLGRVPAAAEALPDEEDRRLLKSCGAAVREVAGEPGDRLLHWDLHFGNVLAAGREPWLAIDPKPLAGDPGFELLPALWNRFGEGGLLRRFDLMTDALGMAGDRERARAWTLGRVLQNSVWDVVDRGSRRLSPEMAEIARTLLAPGAVG